MPGRFFLLTTPRGVARLFSARGAAPDPGPRYNIAPGQAVLIVRLPEQTESVPGSSARELAMARWGLIPPWAAEPDSGGACIDTPVESIRTKPALRTALASRRCVIPADGFYEWPRPASGEPVCFRPRPRGAPFAFAGLWDRWEPGEGGGSAIESCTVLTVAANALVAPVHERMPVILKPRDIDAWLDPAITDAPTLRALWRAYPPELMESYAVSSLLNNPRHDSPALLIGRDSAGASPGPGM